MLASQYPHDGSDGMKSLLLAIRDRHLADACFYLRNTRHLILISQVATVIPSSNHLHRDT